MERYGAACSYCLGRAKRLDGSYLRTLALELKEQLALTFAAIVISIVIQPNRRLDAKEAAEPALRQIIDVLQQVMCAHDAEKLAISVLEICKEERFPLFNTHKKKGEFADLAPNVEALQPLDYPEK